MATSFVSPGIAPPYAAQFSALAQQQAELAKQQQEEEAGLMPGLQDTGALKVMNFNGLANALAASRTRENAAASATHRRG